MGKMLILVFHFLLCILDFRLREKLAGWSPWFWGRLLVGYTDNNT
jgi:hypothetical protein